jgi:hypothetical protein
MSTNPTPEEIAWKIVDDWQCEEEESIRSYRMISSPALERLSETFAKAIRDARSLRVVSEEELTSMFFYQGISIGELKRLKEAFRRGQLHAVPLDLPSEEESSKCASRRAPYINDMEEVGYHAGWRACYHWFRAEILKRVGAK